MYALAQTFANKLHLTFQRKEDHQEASLFNKIPYELQVQIFHYLLPGHAINLSLVCKEWNRLAHDSTLWKVLGKQLGLTHFSSEVARDYHFGVAFSRLHFKENLGEELFVKLEQLKIWKEEIDFKCPEDSFEHGVDNISELTKWQRKEDKKDHFGKKIVRNELILIFISANRLDSKIIRFNLSFNPTSNLENERLFWMYRVGSGCSGFYLDKNDQEQKRSFELFGAWDRLKEELGTFFGLVSKKKPVPGEWFNSEVDLYSRWAATYKDKAS